MTATDDSAHPRVQATVNPRVQTTAHAPVPATVTPIVPLLSYQRRDVTSDARFLWNCWARQTGKSFTKSLRRILRGLERRRTQIFLSAGERQSRELMLKARQHLHALRIAHDFYDRRLFKSLRVKQLEIVLPRNVRIVALPANPETARGFTGDVFLDEFAMHARDREIWAAMFPTLLRGGGELDVASTPKGRQNVFHDLIDNDRFEHSTVTLPEAVAQGLDVDIQAVRSAMGDPELFRQEFLCEFLDEATAFLTLDQIDACTDDRLTPARSVADLICPATAEDLTGNTSDDDTNRSASAAGVPSRRTGAASDTGRTDSRPVLFAGVDIGRKHDLTVIWVLRRCRERYETVGLIEQRGAPFAEQQATLDMLLGGPCVRRCCIDASGLGMQLAEHAVQTFGEHRVTPVTFTAGLKSRLAMDLRIAIEQRRIALPAGDAVRRDLHSVTRSVCPAGHFRLSADRGADGHADRFWALALALHAATSAAGPTESHRVSPLDYARSGTW